MRPSLLLIVFSLMPGVGHADFSSFSTGPIFEQYGPVAEVDVTYVIPDGAELRHSFDVAEGADEGNVNSTLVSAARFINMHARAGVDPNRIEVAIVIHGTAVHDVSGTESSSTGIVAALIEHGVSIIVCGQSAAYYDVSTDDLLPGVKMALSAMTAHALLQQQGYTINPF